MTYWHIVGLSDAIDQLEYSQRDISLCWFHLHERKSGAIRKTDIMQLLQHLCRSSNFFLFLMNVNAFRVYWTAQYPSGMSIFSPSFHQYCAEQHSVRFLTCWIPWMYHAIIAFKTHPKPIAISSVIIKESLPNGSMFLHTDICRHKYARYVHRYYLLWTSQWTEFLFRRFCRHKHTAYMDQILWWYLWQPIVHSSKRGSSCMLYNIYVNILSDRIQSWHETNCIIQWVNQWLYAMHAIYLVLQCMPC